MQPVFYRGPETLVVVQLPLDRVHAREIGQRVSRGLQPAAQHAARDLWVELDGISVVAVNEGLLGIDLTASQPAAARGQLESFLMPLVETAARGQKIAGVRRRQHFVIADFVHTTGVSGMRAPSTLASICPPRQIPK